PNTQNNNFTNKGSDTTNDNFNNEDSDTINDNFNNKALQIMISTTTSITITSNCDS
ncbi:26070_t:CDS:1, partial [Racocetra persica]